MTDRAGKFVGLIALDLDGTLLGPDGKVAGATAKTVGRVRDAGFAVCIATGRTWWESRAAIAACELSGPGVFVTGAVVSEMTTGRTLHRNGLDSSVAKLVAGRIEALGLPAMMLTDAGPNAAEYFVSAGVDVPAALSDWVAAHQTDVTWTNDLARIDRQNAIRIGTVATAHAVAKLEPFLQTELAGRAGWHVIHVPAYHVVVLEVFGPAASKWAGVKWIAESLGVSLSKTIAVGDDVNDVSMLANAGLGVAMGNATAPARAVAKRIIGPTAQNGLAAFLEELAIDGPVAS